MLVAVVVPNEEVANKWAYTNGHISSFDKLCSLDQLNKYVLSELKLTAERNKVTSNAEVYEVRKHGYDSLTVFFPLEF